MSALPKAVRKQIDDANEILDVMQAAPYGLDAEGKPIQPPVDAENTPPISADDAENTPPAEPPVEPPVEPAPAAAVPPAEPDPDHKYKVLQGKYNAEVPRLQAELRNATEVITEVRQRLTNAESLIAAMQHTQTPPPEPSAPAAPSGITDEERAQFGPDLINVIERVAVATVQPQIDERIGSVDTRVKTVEQNAGQAAQAQARLGRERLLAALTEAVPKWVEQNEDAGFLNWLNENDVFAGVPRGQLLTEAFMANDTERVIAVFKGFQSENAVVNPEPPVTPPATPPVEPQQQLDDFVAPGTPKTGTTSAPNESGKRFYTRKDISDFYAKKNEFARKRQPVPDEYVKIEKDIIRAQSEGRIR